MSKKHQQESHWVALSDLMTALMIIFLLLSIVYMISSKLLDDKITTMGTEYDTLKRDINKALQREFENDLKTKWAKWGKAVGYIDGERVIFTEPKILFDTKEIELKDDFKEILDDFYPRYVKLVTSEKFKNSIEEIRIEGHTDSDGDYLTEMGRSQTRSFNTLSHLLNNKNVNSDPIRNKIVAMGWSFSKLMCNDPQEISPCKNKGENKEKSRRVEFRIKTNAEARMDQIIQNVIKPSNKK